MLEVHVETHIVLCKICVCLEWLENCKMLQMHMCTVGG